MSRGKWITLAVTVYLVAISIPTALASAVADIPLLAEEITSEVDDRLREARVNEPAAMPTWEQVTALRLSLIAAADVSLPKRIVETKVLVLCALCGRSERAMRRVQEGTRRIVDYCSAKQCQWTSELEQKHPDWGRDVCVLIGLHKIRIGMTTQQVRESWGWPRDINSTITRWGRHEQWVYGRFPYGSYVYFEKGILTTIQQ